MNHTKSDYQEIRHCACFQMQLYYCHWANGSHDWSVVKHWVGVGQRAGVCLGTAVSVTQSEEADRLDVSWSVSGWGHYVWSWKAAPTHQHTYTQGHEHTNSHTLSWVSIATPNKQSVHLVTRPQQKKREKPTQRGKNRHKSKIESGSGDECGK